MAARKLLLIAGSLREGSFNRKLAAEAVRLFDGETDWGDINLPLFNADDQARDGIPAAVQRLADQIARSDGVLIATPEYNQSIPGGLKNALDWVSRTEGKPWLDKPVAIVSAAAGRTGGARAQYALRLALNPFQPRLLTGPEVMVAGAAREFDEVGRLSSERYLATLTALIEKLMREIDRS